MDNTDKTQHLWVGPCGCYSDIQKPSWKPWFYKPQWYWFGWKTLLPVSFGGDEWCRLDLVVGFTITGRIIIPLWGHSKDTCNESPMERPEGGSEVDHYISLVKEYDEERDAVTSRAKNIKRLTRAKV